MPALARSAPRGAVLEGSAPSRSRATSPTWRRSATGAEGCEIAFHLAAHVGQWGSREEFVAGNVTGTQNALAACRDAGVRRFVHRGTEAALLAGEPLREVDETAPLRPDSKALFAATKALAEQAVRAASADGFATVVVRPRLVWGAGDTTAAAGDRRRGRGGQVRLDRRRRGT